MRKLSEDSEQQPLFVKKMRGGGGERLSQMTDDRETSLRLEDGQEEYLSYSSSFQITPLIKPEIEVEDMSSEGSSKQLKVLDDI